MTQRVLWAVDPFESDPALLRHFLDTLRPIVTAMSCAVEPVYVLSQDQLDVNSEVLLPSMEHYREAAEKALRQLLKDIDLPNLLEPTVLIQNNPTSNSQAVRTLEAHALSTNTDLIAVATHAKSGISRLLLGSFAESLLLHSRVAVLTVNPHSHPFRPPVQILFPTDFSELSFTAFHDAIALAKSFDGKLTIYHYLPNPIEPLIQSGAYLLGGGWLDLSSYVTHQTDRQKRHAETWLQIARMEEVAVDLVIESGKGGVVDAVLGYADIQGSSLIAMAAQSGTLSSVLIGSIARQVVRHARCAVWVHRAPTDEAHNVVPTGLRTQVRISRDYRETRK